MDFNLHGAFATDRAAVAAAPAAPADAAPGPATPGPAPGTGDEVSSSTGARALAVALLVVGVVIALLVDEKDAAFKPAAGFALFAGFYIAAQAIERILELLPVGLGSKKSKANRAVIFPGIAFVMAVVLAEWMGLFYLQAVGVTDLSKNADIIITALAIGGGTKPLHDGIKRLEKAKETPPATT